MPVLVRRSLGNFVELQAITVARQLEFSVCLSYGAVGCCSTLSRGREMAGRSRGPTKGWRPLREESVVASRVSSGKRECYTGKQFQERRGVQRREEIRGLENGPCGRQGDGGKNPRSCSPRITSPVICPMASD